MRKLMAALAIVLVAGSATSSWALVGIENLSYDGSLEFSGVAANNEVDQQDASATSDNRGGVDTRVRVGVNAEVTEGVKGRLEMVRTGGQFGRNLSGTQGGANSIDNETANIRFQNAYVQFDRFLWATTRLGRQYVGTHDDLVWYIGPNSDDNLSVSAIDGINLDWNNLEWLKFNLFLGKAKEDDAQGDTDNNDTAGDVNLNNLSVVAPTILPGGRIWAGYLWGVDANTNKSNDSTKLKIYRVGLNGGVLENLVTYRAEFLQNDGEDESTIGSKVTYEGSAFDLGLGVNTPETGLGSFGVALNYVMASGDSNTGDKKDKSFHDFTELGVGSSDRYYGEIFGKSTAGSTASGGSGHGLDTGSQGQGLNILHLGGKWVPTFFEKKSWAKVDFFQFNTAEDGNTSALPQADKYGTEIDLTLGFKQTDNVSFEGGYALLSPDKAIVGTTAGTPDDDITKWFARAKINWGGAEAE